MRADNTRARAAAAAPTATEDNSRDYKKYSLAYINSLQFAVTIVSTRNKCIEKLLELQRRLYVVVLRNISLFLTYSILMELLEVVSVPKRRAPFIKSYSKTLPIYLSTLP